MRMLFQCSPEDRDDFSKARVRVTLRTRPCTRNDDGWRMVHEVPEEVFHSSKLDCSTALEAPLAVLMPEDLRDLADDGRETNAVECRGGESRRYVGIDAQRQPRAGDFTLRSKAEA